MYVCRTDSLLDNIALRHICVLKSLFVKAAVVIVLWFVSHWQQALEPWMCYCQQASVKFVYLTVQEHRVSYTLSGTFLVKLFWGLNYCLKWLFCPPLTSLVWSKYRPKVKQNSLKCSVNVFSCKWSSSAHGPATEFFYRDSDPGYQSRIAPKQI